VGQGGRIPGARKERDHVRAASGAAKEFHAIIVAV
jgi:hypothetical protein